MDQLLGPGAIRGQDVARTRNSNRPYVLIDWERLGGNIQNAEVHEMGHAFGLGHVGVPGAQGDTSTNIMASAGEGFGSGGIRDLGFSESQAALILYHAERTHGRLGLKAERVHPVSTTTRTTVSRPPPPIDSQSARAATAAPAG